MRFALLLLLLSARAWAGDLAIGERLYDAGRWRDAAAELTPLAEQGGAAAQFLLGAMLLDGGNGLTRDRDRALDLFARAAGQGHAGAMFELYMTQSGAPEGLRWAERLVAQGRRLDGHNRAQAALCAEALGVEHNRGGVVARDPVKARAWLALAVELGRNEAQPALAALDEKLTAEERTRAAALAATLLR